MNITEDELLMIIREELNAVLDEKKGSKRLRKKKAKKKAKKKLDRCARIAKRKYKVWPSAYASGAAVKCRKGKIWKGLKETLTEQDFIEHDVYNPEIGEEKRVSTYEEYIRLTEDGYTHVNPEQLEEIFIDEAEYKGRKVKLNKRMRGDVKKFKAYVKGCGKDKDRVKKINFGDKNMKIKKSNPKRRKSFRARHKCKTAKDKCTARYWSCKAW